MIGFYKLRERFLKAIESNTLSHAHIIVGPDGIGKSAFVEDVARKILGNPDRDSVDIVRVRPEKTTITVNQVRSLVLEAAHRPYEGAKKIIVIYEAHKLGREAQNALLKTIEEPMPGVFFFLLTENDMFLFETVKSRCHMHRLLPLSDEEMREYVVSFVKRHNEEERKRFDEETARREVTKDRKKIDPMTLLEITPQEIDSVISQARGIPGMAESIIHNGMKEESLILSVRILKALAEARKAREREYYRVLGLSGAVAKADITDFFDDFSYAIDCILKEKSLYENPIREKTLSDDIVYLSKEITYSTLQRYLSILYGMRKYIMPGININKDSVISSLLLKLLEV